MLFAFMLAVLQAPSSPTPVPVPAPVVRVIATDADRKACQYLGFVTVRKAMGTNKAGGALKRAFERVAQLGGNGLFLINQSQDWATGASVSGEALRCPSGSP